MEQALIILIVLFIVILSFTAPKLLQWILIIGGFFLILTASIYANGFPAGLIGGIVMGGLVAFLGWLRFRKVNTERERALESLVAREHRINTPIFCEQCGAQRPLHQTPKNFTQFMWGEWTCPKCGAELSSNGKRRVSKGVNR